MGMMREVAFEADGKAYAMRYSTNALCALEAETGESISKLAARMQGDVTFGELRTIFRAGLKGDFTPEAAGDIIDALGIDEAGALIGRAFEAAFPAAEKTVAPGKRRAGPAA